MSLLSTTNLPETLLSRLPRKGQNEVVADSILELLPLIQAEGAEATKANILIAYHNTHQVELKQGTLDSILARLEKEGVVTGAKLEGQGKMKCYSVTAEA